ncbi:vWA domain-containing protein [Nigerium massiliense]|uniref:vWA domain-containing protein n=1 Tax=Nigerium massiliense TaxID=1522317 RepID=UPI001F212084|nr:vWA domain-containing protein [Nigerium massiliense]
MRVHPFRLVALLVAVVLSVAGCTSDAPAPGSSSSPMEAAPGRTLRIVAGSEHQSVLEEIVLPWCREKGYSCAYELKGSVDQSRILSAGGSDRYDAYWFASSVFAQLGNTDGRLTDVQPMFLTPIVYAGWASEMQRLGFGPASDVSVEQVLDAVEGGRTTVWATNPTQSNSGATMYFAFLNWFAGNGPGQALTMEQLASPQVADGISRFVRAMDRTPPSTGTMMNECLEAGPATCKTLFTYEDLVIEKNLELVAAGREPLTVVYPQGALAISDAPLGYFPRADAENATRRTIFTELQQYLLHDDGAKRALAGLGRRPADSVGLSMDNPDQNVFNPAWGIRTDVRAQAITFPAAPVIQKALDDYHVRYRQPANVAYCLDGSGSMSGAGWDGVKAAAAELFDPDRAALNLLQTGPQDRTTLTIFNTDTAAGPLVLDGNDPAGLKRFQQQVDQYRPGGGTNMYGCLDAATRDLQADQRKRLIVLMTDGRSTTGGSREAVENTRRAGIPVVAIAFGDADPEQMQEVAKTTGGAFVKSDDLVAALRVAAGYR